MNKEILKEKIKVNSKNLMAGAGLGAAAKLGSKIASKAKAELAKRGIEFGKGIKSIIPSRVITIDKTKRKEMKTIDPNSVAKEGETKRLMEKFRK